MRDSHITFHPIDSGTDDARMTHGWRIGRSVPVTTTEGTERAPDCSSAAKWVPDADRLTHTESKQAGSSTSLPVLLHVRKAANFVTTRSR